MSLRRRFMLSGGELPSGYKRCEYLESADGYQYIDTLINDVDKRNLVFNIKVSIYNSNGSSILGHLVSDGDDFRIIYYQRILHFYCGNGRLSFPNETILKHGLVMNIQFGNYFIIIPELNIDAVGYKTQNPGPYNIGLFQAYPFNQLSSISRVYSWSVLEDNILIQNFIPALDPTGRPCMYDTVSKKPFYNQGTGEFLYKLA